MVCMKAGQSGRSWRREREMRGGREVKGGGGGGEREREREREREETHDRVDVTDEPGTKEDRRGPMPATAPALTTFLNEAWPGGVELEKTLVRSSVPS